MARVFDYVGGYLTRPNASGQRNDPPEGGVAASWTVSPDGLLYTFTLRPGLTFHDGTQVDATAVVRSLTRQANPADPSYPVGCEMHTNYTFNRKSIHAFDPATVRIELARPDPAYLYRLFHPAAMILSPAALDKCHGGIRHSLVSCGPYQIERFVPGIEVVLTAYTGFWAGRPLTDRLIVRSAQAV
jgi:glutathione transport system substrate-binding protein